MITLSRLSHTPFLPSSSSCCHNFVCTHVNREDNSEIVIGNFFFFGRTRKVLEKEHYIVDTLTSRLLLKMLRAQIPVELSHSDATSAMLIPQDINQGRPGFLGIQFIGVFNFRYTVFLCLELGIVYCFVCQKLYKSNKKSDYLNSHGEEAQEKPPGL